MVLQRLSAVFIVFFFSLSAAAEVEWYEPEVVPESKIVDGKRSLRFSGQTEPGSSIRLTKTKVRTYLENGNFRWVELSAKDKRQFPVRADGGGGFSFLLTLPVQPVELPLEINEGEGWESATLNFRVPQTGGVVSDLTALEDSYSSANTRDDDDYQRSTGEYKSAEDIGQIIERRQNKAESRSENARERIVSRTFNLKLYGGLGPAWVSLHQDMPTVIYPTGPPIPPSIVQPTERGFVHDKNVISIPSWKVGAVYDLNQKWRLEFSIRDTPMQFEPDPGLYEITFPIGQTSWLEAQLGGTYFFKELSMGSLGIDFGLQYHSLPYYRFRNGTSTFVYFDAAAYNVFAGARLQSKRNRKWPWEAYARISVPFLTDSDVFEGTGFGLELGGGADHEIIPGLFVGVWGYWQLYLLSTEFTEMDLSSAPGVPGSSRVNEVDYNLMMLSLEARLTVRF